MNSLIVYKKSILFLVFCANRHESTDVFLREEGHHTSIMDGLKLVHLSWVRNILKINTGRYKIYSFLKNNKNSNNFCSSSCWSSNRNEKKCLCDCTTLRRVRHDCGALSRDAEASG